MLAFSNNISYQEKLLSFFFFLSLTITVWAVRTPHSELGPDWLRTFLAGFFYLLLLVEMATTFLQYRKGRVKKNIFLIAIWPVLYWIYIHIWAFETESFAITSPVIAFVFALQSDTIKKNVFVLFKKLIIVTSLIGVLCYFAYVFKIGIPYSIAPYYDGRPYHNYVNYFNISFLYINSYSIRICGIFNEPGWLGTTIGLLLCYEEFKFKKTSNWILFVAGVLTYSLAFVLILVVGFIIRNITNIKKWGVLLIAVCVFFIVLPNIKTDNPQLNRLIARLELTSNGLKGDNRTTKTADDLLNETLSTSRCLFGYGDGYAEYYNGQKETAQILSIKTEVINFGIVGTFLLYIVPLFFFLKISRKNKKALFFVICFWISLYQRPWLYIVSNYMLLLSTISYLKEYEMCGKIVGQQIVLRRRALAISS